MRLSHSAAGHTDLPTRTDTPGEERTKRGTSEAIETALRQAAALQHAAAETRLHRRGLQLHVTKHGALQEFNQSKFYGLNMMCCGMHLNDREKFTQHDLRD